jgi:hypothetical protein
MMIESTSVPVAAISRAGVSPNQGDICNGDIVPGNSLDEVGN